jgi:hypothetical protein
LQPRYSGNSILESHGSITKSGHSDLGGIKAVPEYGLTLLSAQSPPASAEWFMAARHLLRRFLRYFLLESA